MSALMFKFLIFLIKVTLEHNDAKWSENEELRCIPQVAIALGTPAPNQ